MLGPQTLAPDDDRRSVIASPTVPLRGEGGVAWPRRNRPSALALTAPIVTKRARGALEIHRAGVEELQACRLAAVGLLPPRKWSHDPAASHVTEVQSDHAAGPRRLVAVRVPRRT
jgi:hypothetical protein